MKLLLVSLVFLLLFLVNSSTHAQNINSVSPSFLRTSDQLGTITIYGTFTLGKRMLKLNDASIEVTFTSTTEVTVEIPTFGEAPYNLALQFPSGNVYNVACIQLDERPFVQRNSEIFLIGKGFTNLPTTAYIKDTKSGDLKSITRYNETAISFKYISGMGTSFSFYDTVSIQNIYIITETLTLSPIITDIVYTDTMAKVTGIYDRINTMFFNEYSAQVTTTVVDLGTSKTTDVFPHQLSFLAMGEFPIYIKDGNGRETYTQGRFDCVIRSISNKPGGKLQLLGSFINPDSGYKVWGIGSVPIDPTETSSTMVSLQYPLTTSCGYLFIMVGQYRITNNMLFCPTPVMIDSSFLNNQLFLVVSYLNPTLIGNAQIGIEYQGGTKTTCATTLRTDLNYDVVCNIDTRYQIYNFYAMYPSTSLTVPFRNNPIVESISSTVYQTPGDVIIRGNNLKATNGQTSVSIGGSVCTNIRVNDEGTLIQCTYQSDIPMTSISILLSVDVTLDSIYKFSSPIFSYTCESRGSLVCSGHGTCGLNSECGCFSPWSSNLCNRIYPTLSSITQTAFGTPGVVTIVGNNFDKSNLEVTIGGSPCTIESVGLTEIKCLFQSKTPASANGKLTVFLSIDTINTVQAEIFSYLTCVVGSNGNVCSGHGECSSDLQCICEKGWNDSDCSTINPIIKSSTSTQRGSPGQVTINGENFSSFNLLVTIGGSVCSNPMVSNDAKTITCHFLSDVSVNDINESLEVYVSIDSTFTTSNKVFLYTKPTQTCPKDNNGQVCSSHGTCNQQLLCQCDKGWGSSDCSVKDTGVIIEEPKVNENDTSTIITTPSGTKFDIGITMINELNNNNNIVQSYYLNNTVWSQNQNQRHHFTTTLPNNSTLIVSLTINDKNEYASYDFAGDTIQILPKSIKYQIELYNWTFSNSLNTLEFIFRSGITESDNECNNEQETQTTSNDGDNLRTIQMTLNGETLIGTFSDRLISDNRPTYNKVNKLTNDQIKSYQLDSTPLYTSIQTSSFKNSVIVDPNFGVLVSSTPDKCTNGMPNWKLAVIIVCSVVGAAILVTAVWMLFKKNRTIKIMAHKLKRINK